MRVLMTQPVTRDLGGVARYVASVRPHLETAGVDVSPVEIGATRARPLHVLTDQLAFHAALCRRKPALVHVNPSLLPRSFFRDGAFVAQAIAARVPVVVFFHGWDREFQERVERHWLWFFRRTFGKAAAIVVLAKQFGETLERWGVTAPITVEVTAVDDHIVDGFEIERALAERRQSRSLRVLFLGRLEPAKGVYETIDACALAAQQEVPVKLIVAGDGPHAPAMREYAAQRLGKSAEFKGYVSGNEKYDMIRSCHVMLFPTSYQEGLPISVIEAMCLGLAVVTCPVGGLADLFPPSASAGILVKSVEPAGLAEHLVCLARDPEAREALGRAAFRLVVPRTLASRAALRLRDIYQSAVA